MAEIINNPQKIKSETGYYTFEDFLFPRLQLAGWKMQGPFMVKTAGMRYMFGRMHEKGYWQGKSLPLDISPQYFTPYFLFKPDATTVYKNSVAGIRDVVPNGEAVEVNFDAPVALYNLLKNTFDNVIVKPADAEFTGTVCSKKTSQVEKELNYLRDELNAIGHELVKELATDKKEVLHRYLDQDYFGRFKMLDKYMDEYGFAAVIVTSGLNVQEIAGMPQKHYMDGCIAVYIKGSEDLQIVTTNEFGLLRGQKNGILKINGQDIVLPEGKIGIEEEHMGMGIYLGLGLDKKDTDYASVMLRDWREEWGGHDLASYIIAGLSVRRGLNKAMDHLEYCVEKGISICEKDIYNIHMKTINDFLDAYNVPLVCEEYFANLHSGNRFESPSCYKENYYITKDNNTVKFDTGIRLYDQWGYLRAVSDIARTSCFHEDARKVYEIFEGIMLNVGIPIANIGNTGNDIYMAACTAINEHFNYFKSIDLLPPEIEKLEDIYARDVGHLMGKEEAANHCFKKGETRKFKANMIGCFEIQWGYNRHSFGCEDSFITTEEGPIIFTR